MWQHHKDAGSRLILNTQKVKHQRANTHTNTLRLKRHPVTSEKQTQSGLRSEIYSHFRTSDICSPVQIRPQAVLAVPCFWVCVFPSLSAVYYAKQSNCSGCYGGMCVWISFLRRWDDMLFAHVYQSLKPCEFPKYTSPALCWDAPVYCENKTFSAKCLSKRERERGCVLVRSGQWATHMHLNDVREIPQGNHLSTTHTHTHTHTQTSAQTFT